MAETKAAKSNKNRTVFDYMRKRDEDRQMFEAEKQKAKKILDERKKLAKETHDKELKNQNKD